MRYRCGRTVPQHGCWSFWRVSLVWQPTRRPRASPAAKQKRRPCSRRFVFPLPYLFSCTRLDPQACQMTTEWDRSIIGHAKQGCKDANALCRAWHALRVVVQPHQRVVHVSPSEGSSSTILPSTHPLERHTERAHPSVRDEEAL